LFCSFGWPYRRGLFCASVVDILNFQGKGKNKEFERAAYKTYESVCGFAFSGDAGECFFLLACAWALWHGSFKPFGVFRYIRDYAVVACSHFGKRINAIYEFDERLKTLVFFIAYLWTTMLGYALGFMINNWFFRPLQMILTAAEWIYLNF